MTEEQPCPVDNASQLQEAIDSIVQTFDYPGTLSIQYTYDDDAKRTIFEIRTGEREINYELRYNGYEETEPELTRQS